MSEKHEKWIIFALIALVLWWLFKKYGAGQTAVVSNTVGGVPGDTATTYYPPSGSMVNPRTEYATPAETTTKIFPAAQPYAPYAPLKPSITSAPPRIASASAMIAAGPVYSGGNVSSPILRNTTSPYYRLLAK